MIYEVDSRKNLITNDYSNSALPVMMSLRCICFFCKTSTATVLVYNSSIDDLIRELANNIGKIVSK